MTKNQKKCCPNEFTVNFNVMYPFINTCILDFILLLLQDTIFQRIFFIYAYTTMEFHEKKNRSFVFVI